MLSGIGPGRHLRDIGIDVAVDSSGVGQNLQDHPAAGILSYTRDTTDIAEMLGLGNLVRWKATGKGPLTSNVGEAGAFYTSRDDLALPDLQFHVSPTGFYDHGLHEPVRRALTIGRHAGTRRELGPRQAALGGPDVAPRDRSGLLRRRRRPRRHDRRMSHGAWRWCARGRSRSTSPSRGSRVDQPDDDDISRRHRAAGQTLYHPVATCSMGTVEGSVVDPELKVHGIDGLRVADASVMPSVPRGNTNAPTIMIGEKCADLIKESR